MGCPEDNSAGGAAQLGARQVASVRTSRSRSPPWRLRPGVDDVDETGSRDARAGPPRRGCGCGVLAAHRQRSARRALRAGVAADDGTRNHMGSSVLRSA